MHWVITLTWHAQELEIIQLAMEEIDVRKKLYQNNQVGSGCNASDL
jgi:hypothetical protein